MKNNVQTFSGFQVPPNHIIRLSFFDTDQSGIFNIGLTYLQNDKIKNYHQAVDASEYANDYFNVDIDLYDSKILSITCYITGQRNINCCRRVNVYLVNQQGRGNSTIVGLLTQQDVSQYQPLCWPYNGNVNHFTPYGVPTSLSMTVDDDECSVEIPGEWIFRLGGVRVKLTTDANVADRDPYLRVVQNAVELFRSADTAKQVANRTKFYSYARGVGDTENSSINTINYPVPDFVVHGGAEFIFLVNNFQATDEIENGTIWGEYIYNG